MTFWLPIGDDANELLRRNPLALLIGMTLDQQVPMERAFSAPYDLVQRLGHEPDPHELATFDPDALIELFARRPALHRFPKAMAGRVQQVCQTLVERHDGDAAALWNGATDGRELLKRVSDLPGFGRQKAQIFVALLGKQFGVRPPGWREAVGDYGQAQAYRSIADVIDEASLGRVREHKKRMKAEARSATGT
ncbi:HhH-GPD-type base excision DNA repair protein [Pilimelia columellifera]|uniref:HhH-GPD-type base excision DNA repair protein n=1 Tax=Pilimelia columellifera subsp. columellifera TaxID=706583 RepID=A0ABP6AA10_9ACTN